MKSDPPLIPANLATRSKSGAGAGSQAAQTAAIAIRSPVEKGVAFHPSKDDKRTLRSGLVPGPLLHAFPVAGRDASMVPGFG